MPSPATAQNVGMERPVSVVSHVLLNSKNFGEHPRSSVRLTVKIPLNKYPESHNLKAFLHAARLESQRWRHRWTRFLMSSPALGFIVFQILGPRGEQEYRHPDLPYYYCRLQGRMCASRHTGRLGFFLD